MIVRPRDGYTVRDPRTKLPIGNEGVLVPAHDLDFHRLIADGDLVEVTESAGEREGGEPA